jgi:uncharacterized membrane protein YfcA
VYYLGLFLSLFIGVVLGLIGGGGAILTIPLVVYFFGQSTDTATTYSLIIVTVSSLVGIVQRFGTKQISYKEALIFVFPSMTLAFLIRRYRKMVIPEDFEWFGFQLTRDFFIDILLVVVMLIVAYRMFRPLRQNLVHKPYSVPKIMALGLITGGLSGFLGAGGGFIIVPILVGMGLEIKRAIGTSLFIIAIQSSIALLGDLSAIPMEELKVYNWNLVFLLTFFSIGGVFVGTYLQRKISGNNLRIMFASLLVAMAILIFVDRILLFLY